MALAAFGTIATVMDIFLFVGLYMHSISFRGGVPFFATFVFMFIEIQITKVLGEHNFSKDYTVSSWEICLLLFVSRFVAYAIVRAMFR